MPRLDDLTGQRFGSLTAIRQMGFLGSMAAWEFQCDCGQTIVRRGSHVKFSAKHGVHMARLHCGCKAKKKPYGFDYPIAAYALWTRIRRNGGAWKDDFSAFYHQCYLKRGGKRHLLRYDLTQPYGPDNCFWDDEPQLLCTTKQRVIAILRERGDPDPEGRVARVSRQRVFQMLWRHERRCTQCSKTPLVTAALCQSCYEKRREYLHAKVSTCQS